MSGAMEKIKAKVENVLHKDKSTTHDDPTGPHSSHSANKADPRVDSDHIGTTGNHSSTTHGTTHGTTGGLTGNTDSYGTTGTTGLTGSNTHSHGTTGGLTGSSNTYGSDPTGPHDSHLGNKADPRVDSDRVGGYGNTSSTGGHSSGLTGSNTHGHSSGLTGSNTHSSGLTGSNTHSHGTTGGLTGSSNTYGSDPTGPHDSHLANKADPRVDSDRVGTGAGYNHSGLTGSNNHGTTGLGSSNTYGSDPTGPHDSHLGNRADPRVDSSTTGGYGNTTGAGGYGNTGAGVGGLSSGPGPAENTAGPHKSDMLNKADPRVDSDLDGSKTYGGNKTSGF